MELTLESLAVVSPFYNEESTIEHFYREVTGVLADTGLEVRFVFVDDGSSDRTLEMLNRLADNDERITVISLARNFGHQIALTAGLDYADADAAVTMDSDLQHPPATILEMIEAFRAGHHVVYGVRRDDQTRDWLKRTIARTFYRLLRNSTHIEVIEGAVDFRLMSGDVVRTLQGMRETHRYLRGMVPWVGHPYTTVEYTQQQRTAGDSKYSWWKLWQLARAGLFSFSSVPLDLITWIGTVFTVLAGLYLVYVLSIALFTDLASSIPGWVSQTAVILLIGGVQLISLGVIAQYIGMIFEEVKGRPLYTVKQIRLSQPARVEVPPDQ